MMKATWSRSFKAITAGWVAASWCRNSDSCFKIAANCFRWNRDTRTLRAGQASVSYDHSRMCDERRQTVGNVWGDGRRDATAGPRASADESNRFQFECAGSRRRVALATRRRQRTNRRKNGKRRLRESRIRHSRGDAARIKKARPRCAGRRWRLRRLSSNQSGDARWPTRLRWRKRIAQRRPGGRLLIRSNSGVSSANLLLVRFKLGKFLGRAFDV